MTSPVDGTFARHLRDVVYGSGLPIPEFAELVGINESTLRSWLSGRNEPQGLSRLRRIKRHAGCTWEELLG